MELSSPKFKALEVNPNYVLAQQNLEIAQQKLESTKIKPVGL